MSDEKINIDLIIETAKSATSVKDMKKSLREIKGALNQIEEAGGSSTKEFLNLASAAGEINDKMEDTNKVIGIMKDNASKLGAVANVGKGIAAGFEGATAASALFGKKAEDVEKALLKVQAASSLTRAIGEMAEFGKTGKEAALVIKQAFASNPVGAVLVALGAIAAIGTAIYSNYFSATAQAEEELEVQKQITSEAEAHLDFTNKLDAGLRLAGKTEKQILQYKIKQTEQVIDQEKKEIEKALYVKKVQEQTAKRNRDLTQMLIRFVSFPITAMLKSIDYLSKGLVKLGVIEKELDLENQFSGGIAGLIFDPEKTKTEGDKELDEMTKKLQEHQVAVLNYKEGIQKIDDEYAKKAKELRDKEAEEIRKQQEKDYNDHLEYLNKLQAELDKDAEKRNKNELDAQSEFEKLSNENLKASTEDKKKLLDIEMQNELDALKQKYEDTEAYNALVNEVYKKYNKERIDLAKEEADKQKQLESEVADAKVNSVKGTLTAISDLTTAFAGADEESQKRAFEINKAMSLANATISGIEGTVNAFTTAAKSPITTLFPAYPFVQAGLAGAAAIAQLAKIKSTQFQGGGSSNMAPRGGGGGSFGGGQQNFNANNLPQLYKVGGNDSGRKDSKQQVIKAVVVSHDITKQQNADAVIKRRASL